MTDFGLYAVTESASSYHYFR